jgi:hypothetical protein
LRACRTLDRRLDAACASIGLRGLKPPLIADSPILWGSGLVVDGDARRPLISGELSAEELRASASVCECDFSTPHMVRPKPNVKIHALSGAKVMISLKYTKPPMTVQTVEHTKYSGTTSNTWPLLRALFRKATLVTVDTRRSKMSKSTRVRIEELRYEFTDSKSPTTTNEDQEELGRRRRKGRRRGRRNEPTQTRNTEETPLIPGDSSKEENDEDAKGFDGLELV